MFYSLRVKTWRDPHCCGWFPLCPSLASNLWLSSVFHMLSSLQHLCISPLFSPPNPRRPSLHVASSFPVLMAPCTPISSPPGYMKGLFSSAHLTGFMLQLVGFTCIQYQHLWSNLILLKSLLSFSLICHFFRWWQDASVEPTPSILASLRDRLSIFLSYPNWNYSVCQCCALPYAVHHPQHWTWNLPLFTLIILFP